MTMQELKTDLQLNKNILIVDDNKSILSDFKKLLVPDIKSDDELDDLEQELFGFETPRDELSAFQANFFEQGMDAYDFVRSHLESEQRYAMAFLDMRMPPGWSGVETAKKLWEVDPDIEIVFCTAFSDYSINEMRAILGDSSNFLLIRKPFDSTEIIQAANASCEKWFLKQRAKQDLNQMRQQLLQADKMASIGQLAAGVAHEINNPVGFINSNITTLAKYFRNVLSLLDLYKTIEAALPEGSSDLEKILAMKKEVHFDLILEDFEDIIKESQEGVRRVTTIVNDLKSFSRVGNAEWSWCDIHQGIESSLNIAMNQIKYHANVVKKFGDIPQIKGVISQLNQVFLNLLVNAGQAIEDQGEIIIETGRVNDTHIFIKISDTGCGIEPNILPKIFDPFFTTKPVGKGTGLGLSLSYGIIHKHHGKFDVDSEVGKGSTFTITLPIEQDDTDQEVK